jgi:hypothetical protein
MDNRYHNYKCPPLMNDGRFISNYVRSSTFDQYIRNQNKIQTSHDYRHYLQNNGSSFINNLKAYYHENNTCAVKGKCLPMSGVVMPTINDEEQNKWYENLLDDPTPQLDFMMTQTSTVKPSNTCFSCKK